MDVLYSTSVTSTGGRDGGVKSADGTFETALVFPKELGGPGGKPNPEILFGAGYASCFHSALKLVAGQEKVAAHDSTVTANVHLGKNAEGGFALALDLKVSLPGVDAEKAAELVRKAHQICPYSNATRGVLPVKLEVVTAGEPVLVS